MKTKDRIDGASPNGGVATEVYFTNDDGDAVDESEATQVEFVELDSEGKEIARTYGSISPKSSDR